jgi:O-antigen/teichoic acid export membrane protein
MPGKISLPIFWRNIALVFQGQLVAQFLPLLSYIVIANFINPEVFAIFAIWFGLSKFFSVCASLRLENALVNEPDGEARNKSVVMVFLTILLMLLPISIVIALLFLFSPQFLPAFSPSSWGLLLIFALLLAGDANLQSWAAADGRYGDLNKIRLAQAGLISILQIVSAFFFRDANALFVGTCLGATIAILVSYFIWPIRAWPGLKIWAELTAFWERNKKFAQQSFPAGCVSSLVAQLPVLIIGSRFGLEIAGQLALTLKIMAAPVGLLGRAVQDVFKRQAAIDLANLGNCSVIYLKMLIALSLGAILFVSAIVGFGEVLFVLVFGIEWRQAGVFAVWMSPTFALGFMVSPLSCLIFIVRRQELDLAWQIVLLLSTFLTLSIAENAAHALVAFTLMYCAMYALYIWITFRLSLGGGLFKPATNS